MHFLVWAGHGPMSDQNGHAGWLATTFRNMAPIWTMFDTAPATLDFQEILGCRQTRAFHCRFRCKKCIFWSGLGMAPFWTKTLACWLTGDIFQKIGSSDRVDSLVCRSEPGVDSLVRWSNPIGSQTRVDSLVCRSEPEGEKNSGAARAKFRRIWY